MKNKIAVRALVAVLIVLLILPILLMFTGCAPAEDDIQNLDVKETTKETTRRAIVYLPNGEIIEGEYTHRYMYSCGAVEVTIDGISYTTHFSNVVLVEE